MRFVFAILLCCISLAHRPVQAQLKATVTDVAVALDAFFSSPERRFDGAVVAIVSAGEIVYLKGYGYENLAQKMPVDASQTRFLIASIGKTLIGTRIAQLIESGKIGSLDDPANKYLKGMAIPDNAGKPITLRHLLTHQGGFAEGEIADFAPGAKVPSLGAPYFASKIPPFIRAADTGANYSNYSLGIAGRVISDVTAQPLERSLAESIWQPSGMRSAAFKAGHAPIERMVQAHAYYPNGDIVPLPYATAPDPIIVSGGGSVWVSGNDMARYMLALLGGSPKLNIPPLVKPETRAMMFAKQGKNDPRSQAYGMAFMLNDWNGQQIVEHSGRLLAAQSTMVLLPEHNIGIFVTTSGEFGAPSGADLLGQLVGRGRLVPLAGSARFRVPNFFDLRAAALIPLLGLPLRDVPAVKPADVLPMASYAGSFESQRRKPASSQKPIDWFIKGTVSTISADDEVGLTIGSTKGWKPLGGGAFWRQPTGPTPWMLGYDDLITYASPSNGRVDELWFNYSDATYSRLSPWRTPAAALSAVGWGSLLLLTGILAVLWRKDAPTRSIALSLPVVLVLIPIVYFASWPAGLPVPFNSLILVTSDLWPPVLMVNLLFSLSVLMIWRLYRAPPVDSIGKTRAIITRMHAALLITGGLIATYGFWVLDLFGWPR
jgi:CubicO group peptidase (beta-lactamase class C family)